MDLNEFGKIVENQIEWLAEQYKYVEIHNYVVMPNHVHMIIEIDRNKLMAGTRRDSWRAVRTDTGRRNQNKIIIQFNRDV